MPRSELKRIRESFLDKYYEQDQKQDQKQE